MYLACNARILQEGITTDRAEVCSRNNHSRVPQQDTLNSVYYREDEKCWQQKSYLSGHACYRRYPRYDPRNSDIVRHGGTVQFR
jgi:hypothetical protein